ncbi:hypothetical protein DFH08DRAFT_795044 [Mycena albidolilacea]|uniref:C2H2-type domain-containing protein n=1 Tax=Mycena albidolilacea TaxID=1033008 RepID=A0AAD6YYD3_9AGAR|nr:hypothetical protein DFH08DRAFT_795044 [Mycena albidolilacea]
MTVTILCNPPRRHIPDVCNNMAAPIVTLEQQATSPTTMRASRSRRDIISGLKQPESKRFICRMRRPAPFVCPVPHCGSTFTRSFNLKGHIRSHTGEKPFVCKWPECGKGFARTFDCKRHEQLHTVFRPFACGSGQSGAGGCGKMFARMDALNRHLRSEGGAECQRTLEASGGLPDFSGDGLMPEGVGSGFV